MKKNLIILFLIIVAVIGIYYFASGVKPVAQNQNQTMISVDAKRWQFTPDIIRIKKGQIVKIIINNTDTIHGINLPDFNAAGDNSIEFTADKTGEFTFFCKNFCGEGHKNMTGKIIVTE